MKKIFLVLFGAISPLLTWGANYYYIWIDGIQYNLESNSKTGSKAEVIYASHTFDYNDEYGYSGDVTIPETVDYNGITFTVTSISDYAFKNCHELTSVNILGGVERIGKSAFENCENLCAITIPSSVQTIGEYAFGMCWSLGSINISDLVSWCNITFAEGFYYRHKLLLNGVEIKDLVIPDGVSAIKSHTFAYSNITSLKMPNSVIEIDDDAFGNCINLNKIEFSNNIKTIGKMAFVNCSKLENLYLPNALEEIGDYAFASCNKIESLIIPSNVKSIGPNAFNCNSIISIVVDTNNATFDSRENCNAVIEKESATLIVGCQTSFIPRSVVSIGDNAFSYCTNLSSIEIPNNVKTIGQSAFYGCSSLSNIIIPSSITEIGQSAFGSCVNLESIDIQEGVTAIGSYAFSSCNKLSEVTLPNSVSTIPGGCFCNCEKLANIQLGANVKKIGYSAFSNCQELIDVYCYTREIPETEYGVFDGSYIEYATLHVPSSSVTIYKATEPWSKFKDVVSIAQSEYTLTYLVDGSVYKTYNIREGERIIPEPEPIKEGYTFLGWSVIPEYMPACDVTITGSFINTNFVDGTIYSNNITVENVILTYTRTFNNTNWQALYVPFSMSYDDWKDDFDVAEINNFHEYDDDEDGTVDRTTLEVVYKKSGNTLPNTPYVIRAKQTGTKTISLDNTTLYPAEENSIDCSSVKTKYTFTGTYSGVSGEAMYGNGYYALAGGVLSQASSSSVSLGSFRWYLKSENRTGSYVAPSRQISVKVRGEEDEMTGIEDEIVNDIPVEYFNIKGSKISQSEATGIYIVRYADGRIKKVIKK